MLLGEYEHTLDDKNRLTLPAKFRQAFAGEVVVSRGLDGCLFVFTRDNWDSFVGAQLQELSPFSKEARQMSRYMPAEPEIEPDRENAIAIALERAGEGDVVVIAGKGHEQGQEFADRTVPFDDREVAREALRRQAASA